MAAIVKRLGGIILALIFGTAQAQTFHSIPDSNASWGQFLGFYGIGSPGFGGQTHFITADGTTSIDSFDYVKISFTTGSFAFIREDSTGKVWYYDTNDSTEKLTYDFSANAGDTIYVWNGWEPISWMPGYVEVVIDSVDTVTMNNGELRKRLFTNWYNYDFGMAYWIEGVGSSWGLPYPAFAEIIDATSWMTCFTQNDTVKWGDVCDLILSIDNAETRYTAQAFPNPNNGTFTLQFPKRLGGTAELTVQNTLGQIVHRATIETTNGLVEVNLNNVANGLYTITVRRDDGIYNAKVLISN